MSASRQEDLGARRTSQAAEAGLSAPGWIANRTPSGGRVLTDSPVGATVGNIEDVLRPEFWPFPKQLQPGADVLNARPASKVQLRSAEPPAAPGR